MNRRPQTRSPCVLAPAGSRTPSAGRQAPPPFLLRGNAAPTRRGSSFRPLPPPLQLLPAEYAPRVAAQPATRSQQQCYRTRARLSRSAGSAVLARAVVALERGGDGRRNGLFSALADEQELACGVHLEKDI